MEEKLYRYFFDKVDTNLDVLMKASNAADALKRLIIYKKPWLYVQLIDNGEWEDFYERKESDMKYLFCCQAAENLTKIKMTSNNESEIAPALDNAIETTLKYMEENLEKYYPTPDEYAWLRAKVVDNKTIFYDGKPSMLSFIVDEYLNELIDELNSSDKY